MRFKVCQNNPVDRRLLKREEREIQENKNVTQEMAKQPKHSERDIQVHKNVTQEMSKQPKLGIAHLKNVFLFLLIGQLLSICVFFIEVIYFYFERSHPLKRADFEFC